jgi:ATP-binding cassette, subfamily C (CFTR/MRP), member 1
MDVKSDQMKDGSSNPYTFLKANFAVFKWQIFQTIPPRLAVSGFTYAQTFLITAAIVYLELPSELRNVNHAYGLIGATFFIYSGIAVNDLP